MHPTLNIAIKAARKAGALINRASLDIERVRVSRKQQKDFVTEVDQAAEQAILEVLMQSYPDHYFLGEEGGLVNAQGRPVDLTDENGNPKRPKGIDTKGIDTKGIDNLWIIDPLDGTTNFIHGLPIYAVSIGLMHKGQITQAVVYDPSRDELFVASRGEGAMVNGRRIRVALRDRLDEALIGTGFPFRDGDPFELYTEMFRTFASKTAGLRRPGSAALDLCYVAAGRYDGFFEMGLMPWDAAAGSLLVTEAGGYVGNFKGDGDYLFSENIVAGSPKIFAQMVSLLAPHEIPHFRGARKYQP